MFNFKCLDVLWSLFRHPSQKIWHLEFAKSLWIQFWTSRYFMVRNQTFESKVMAVSICHEFLCLIFSVSMYYCPQSDIWVQSNASLNLVGASVSILRVSIYCGPQSDIQVKSYGRLNFLGLACSISSISIYYRPQSDFRVKSYGSLNLLGASMFNFKCLDILWSTIRHLSQKLW